MLKCDKLSLMVSRVRIDKTLFIRRKGDRWRILSRGLNGTLVVARGHANEKLDGGGYKTRADAERALKLFEPESELIRLDTQMEQAAQNEVRDVLDGETPAGSRHLGEGKILPKTIDVSEESPLWMSPQDVFFRQAGNPIRAYGDCCRSAEAERIYREKLVASDPQDDGLRADHMEATVRHAGLLGHVMRHLLPTYQSISVDTPEKAEMTESEKKAVLGEVERTLQAAAIAADRESDG